MRVRSLESLYNRPTSYEVVFYDNGVVTHLGFTAKKTNREILFFARKHSDVILNRMEELSCGDDSKPKKGVWDFGNGLMVKFSGKTEHDYASEIAKNQ